MGERSEKGRATKAPPQPPPVPRRKPKRVEAMSHPLRARILRALVEGGVMSPAQISRVLNANLRTVSNHVRRLEELECVELVYTRPVRGAVQHFYRATEQPLIDADEFEELDPIMADDMVCDAMQRILDDFVASRKAKMIGSDKYFHLTRHPRILDEQGFLEAMNSMDRCRLELAEIGHRADERRAETGSPGIPTSADFLLFKIPSKALDT